MMIGQSEISNDREQVDPEFFCVLVKECSTEELLHLMTMFEGWWQNANCAPHRRIQIQRWIETFREAVDWLPGNY